MKSLEKSVSEWKRKCSDLQSELEGAGGDARSAAADAFRYKSEVEERDDQIEALRREIRGLSKWLRSLYISVLCTVATIAVPYLGPE